jgi:pSer/pThr/pTyr-binding forkhead associated (FHA) protein
MARWLLRSVAPPLFCRDLPLETGVWTIGRSTKCDLVVKHRSISRRHAKIEVSNSGVQVSDLGSRNGTWVYGKQVNGNTPVVAGQDLRFGDVIFVALPGDHAGCEEIGWEDETPVCESDQAEAILSPAQCRVLAELLDGSSEKEIATKLHLSPHTVHNHIAAIRQRFGFRSRSELLASRIPKGT